MREAFSSHERRIASDRAWHKLSPLTDFGLTRRVGLHDELVRKHGFLIRQAGSGVAFGYRAPPAARGQPSLIVAWERVSLESDGDPVSVFCDTPEPLGMWLSCATDNPASFATIVIAQQPLDALAYAQLFQPPSALLIALGGELPDGVDGAQGQLLMRVCQRLERAAVILAADGNSAGDVCARRVIACVPGVSVQQPFGTRGWLDVLRQEMCITV